MLTRLLTDPILLAVLAVSGVVVVLVCIALLRTRRRRPGDEEGP